jgi:adenylosuccinate lyase
MQRKNTAISSLSPLDGRYLEKTKILQPYFSEFGLIRSRLLVEVEYLVFISEKKLITKISKRNIERLRAIVSGFNQKEANKIKKIEEKIRHDVKSVEYYLKNIMIGLGISGVEYIHIGLTSADINSIAYGIGLKMAMEEVITPKLDEVLLELMSFSDENKEFVMIARTHGQPAVPTTMGKEIGVFVDRLVVQLEKIRKLRLEAKCSGAVGNYNAHEVAFPSNDWLKFGREFIESFGLNNVDASTQTVAAESYVELFQALSRINCLLIDFDQDIWRYISDGYISQRVVKHEVGSSTMPQKVNPIDFENSEGNLGLANAMFGFFNQKLPISRLQRDLSDSTVRRNFGVALGYCLLGYDSLLKGISKIEVDKEVLSLDLMDHWEVIMEGVQTILRVSGDTKAYEKIKLLSRGKKISQESYLEWVKKIWISQEVRDKLLVLSPINYVGKAEKMVEIIKNKVNKYIRKYDKNKKK